MREQSEHESTLYYEVYVQDEVVIKINGQVTFSFTGFENVEQTNSNWQRMDGGIRSGDPANGGSFQHTFDTPGVYYFNSYVHTTLRLKVTRLGSHGGRSARGRCCSAWCRVFITNTAGKVAGCI